MSEINVSAMGRLRMETLERENAGMHERLDNLQHNYIVLGDELKAAQLRLEKAWREIDVLKAQLAEARGQQDEYYKSLLITYGWEPSKEGAATWLIGLFEKLHDAEGKLTEAQKLNEAATRFVNHMAAGYSVLASWYPLVRATDGSKTGAYELKVGDLHLRSYDWDEEKAKKWMPVIVAAVNAANTNMRLEERSAAE